MHLNKTKPPLSILNLVSLCLFSVLFPSLSLAQNFTINENYLLFQSDLANVYNKYGALPDFKALDWCLLESNSGFAFLYCEGLDTALIFDSESFLAGKKSLPEGTQSPSSTETNYELLKKITEEEATPSMI